MSLNIQFLPLPLIFLYRRRRASLLPSPPTTSFRLCISRHIHVPRSTINDQRFRACSPCQYFQRLRPTSAFPTILRPSLLLTTRRHQATFSTNHQSRQPDLILPTTSIRSLRTSARQHTSAAIRIHFEAEDDIELHSTFARHFKLAGVCRDYEFHQSLTNLFMSAQLPAPTDTHTKHYIQLRIAQDCGSMSKEILPFVPIFRILRRRGCRTDASRTEARRSRLPDIHIRVRSLNV